MLSLLQVDLKLINEKKKKGEKGKKEMLKTKLLKNLKTIKQVPTNTWSYAVGFFVSLSFKDQQNISRIRLLVFPTA